MLSDNGCTLNPNPNPDSNPNSNPNPDSNPNPNPDPDLFLPVTTNHRIPTQTLTVTEVDVWALGCILYTLTYWKHPFQDEGKLGIVNAQAIRVRVRVRIKVG